MLYGMVRILHFVLTKVNSLSMCVQQPAIPWIPKSGFEQFEISPFEAFWSSIIQFLQIC